MLTFERFSTLPKTLLQAADGPSQADVYEFFWRGQSLIAKDYSQRPSLYQRTVCRWQFRREWMALLKLRHVPHVPRAVARLDEHVLVMTKLEVAKDQLNEQNAASLEKRVSLMHQAGVTHNDLHSRNLMLDQARAYIFDFGTALFRPLHSHSKSLGGSVRNLARELLFRTGCFFDRMAVTKYKVKHNPMVLSSKEQPMLKLVLSTRWMSRLWHSYKRR